MSRVLLLVAGLAGLAGLVVAPLAVPGEAVAQDAGAAAIPRPASGTPALVLPLQDAVPLPSGGWPGDEGSRSALLERFGAEIDFAVAEGDRGPAWVGPRELRSLVRRNPMLGVDPDRLAAERLPPAGEDLPATLHGQLRDLSAATGARYAVLPERLVYRRHGPPAAACPSGREEGDPDGEVAGAAVRDTAAPSGPGRAVLCVAMLDVRGARVLWRGAVVSPPLPPGDASLLATLAQRLLATFSGGT